MSILTTDDLRANSRQDPATHCWHWLRGRTIDGYPAMHTLCHTRLEKLTMTGSRAVWNIAHGRIPAGALVYRLCACPDCVNPAHMALAYSRAEVGLATRRSGKLKGTHLEARRASAALARQAQAMHQTPDDLVLQIRAAQGSHRQIARALGMPYTTVGNIRSGRRRGGVSTEQEATA